MRGLRPRYAPVRLCASCTMGAIDTAAIPVLHAPGGDVGVGSDGNSSAAVVLLLLCFSSEREAVPCRNAPVPGAHEIPDRFARGVAVPSLASMEIRGGVRVRSRRAYPYLDPHNGSQGLFRLSSFHLLHTRFERSEVFELPRTDA